ncbi:restriction endonuclease subunit S [Streptococcus iniae]|uniref:restriction endonuclease subunit S n=1 Tax=Streptococcus iniae TaxID=1346 RepID=UPI0035C6A6CF
MPKSEENLEENDNGYHVYGQNIDYQYPQKVINDSKYLTVVEKGKPIIAYTSSTAQIGIINESFYRTGNNGAFQGLFPKFNKSNFNVIVFILECIKRTFIGFGYNTSMANILDIVIHVPTKNKNLDFDFMDSFIAELEAERIAKLEAYLKVSGLDNYELSVEELKALRDYDSIDFEEFEYQEVFDKIVQGRRLKKDDQIPGDIPFVMSGVTNTGIVNFISNPVASFPRNSITLDIFGNAFYRPYAYGAGDDTGVYWNEENEYSKEVMLYITSSMSRSVAGKYDYGNKLRSSKSKNIKMKLPAVSKGVLDTDYMRIFTNAVMKLAIKDVVQYTNERIETTKEVVTSHNTNY